MSADLPVVFFGCCAVHSSEYKRFLQTVFGYLELPPAGFVRSGACDPTVIPERKIFGAWDIISFPMAATQAGAKFYPYVDMQL